MICIKCAQAAQSQQHERKTGVPLANVESEHPTDCDCDCQHKPVGSWNGGVPVEDLNAGHRNQS